MNNFANKRRQDCLDILNNQVSKLEKLKGESLYITGGTGFIGTWFAEMITALNDEYGFDINLYLVSRNPTEKSCFPKYLSNHQDITIISKDVRNITSIPDDVSYIVHAAATPDYRLFASNPIETMDIISNGTNRILENAINLQNLKKFLNLSSGKVYGKTSKQLTEIPENYAGRIESNSTLSVYPEAKRYAETLCCAYRSLYKIPTVNVRPFSFIGPYMSPEKPWAINNFIRDALISKKIRIIGNGKPVRSYMYASDMVFWLLKILVDGQPGLAYNVGNSEGGSLKESAEKIARISGNEVEIEILCMNSDESVFVPDTTLAQKSFDLDITVDSDEALEKTIKWYRNLLKSESK